MGNNTSKALKGISSQAIVTILLGILEIVSFSIMSRLLSKEDFGFFAAVNAIVVVFSSLSDTGIGSAIVQKKDMYDRYLGNALSLSIVFGLSSMAILFISSIVLPDSIIEEKMRIPLMLMSFTLLLNCISSVFRSVLHRRLKFLTIGLVQLISLILTTAIAVVLAIKGLGYYAIITKAVLGSVFSCILFFLLSKTKYSLSFDKDTFKSIFSFSGWLMASRFFSDLSKQVDKLIMPKIMPISELGAYTRPKDFTHTISQRINGVFDSALFPVLSSIQDNFSALRSAYKRSLSAMNTFSLLLSLAFALNADLLLRIFFGEDWLYLAPVFIVFSVSVFFNASGRIADCYLRSLGKTKQQFFFRVLEFITKTIGVVVGSRWGLIGVAIAVTIMECLMKLAKVVYAGKLISFSFGNIIGVSLKSCRFSVVLIPICLLVYWFVPHTSSGEIVLACVFAFSAVVLFLFFPSVVGDDYKKDFYPIVMKYVHRIPLISLWQK